MNKVLEAEDAILTDIHIGTFHRGFDGDGYADFLSPESSVKYRDIQARFGEAELFVRYAGGKEKTFIQTFLPE